MRIRCRQKRAPRRPAPRHWAGQRKLGQRAPAGHDGDGLDVMAPFLADSWRGYPAIVLEVDVSARFVDLVGENFDVAFASALLETMPRSRRARLRPGGGLYASPAYLKECGTPRDPDALLAHHAVYARGDGQPVEWLLQHGKIPLQGLPAAIVIGNSPDLLLRMQRMGRALCSPSTTARSPTSGGPARPRPPEWEISRHRSRQCFPGANLMPGVRAFHRCPDASSAFQGKA